MDGSMINVHKCRDQLTVISSTSPPVYYDDQFVHSAFKIHFMRKPVFSFLFLFACVCAIAQSAKEPVRVTDMLKIKSIGGITLSNDGSKAAFTVTAIEPDGDTKWEYKYVNQVWLVNTDGNTAPKQITSKDGSSQPA